MKMLNKFFLQKDSEVRFFGAVLVLLIALLIFSLVMGLKVRREDASSPGGRATVPFPTVTVEAKAIYVYDVRTKTVLYAKNEETRMSLASLTKLMSALVAYEIAQPKSTIVVSREAIRAEGDSGLKGGERWMLKDLLDFSLITSSNDGMRAVALSLGALSNSLAKDEDAENDFVQKMNERAAELDLKNTYFFNETGLDEAEYRGGAYGTAKDVAVLFEHILTSYPQLLEATKYPLSSFSSLDNRAHNAKNTNVLINEIPGLLASKTGFTDVGGGNLVIAFDPELGRPIIVAVLGSSAKGRFEDMRTIVGATMEYLTGEELSIYNSQFPIKNQ